ncbi:MAG: hypothetical protein C0391_04090 [Anaerolinea sp.]|nr:hypothetical protein [Anaerolinea sp.]
MDYIEPARDFALRTLENLKTIRQIQKDHPEYKIYEVTLLINSMLGLLVIPKEIFFHRIPRLTLEEMASDGWPIPRAIDGASQTKDLRELITRLRNAITHGNLQFIRDDKGEIESVIAEDFNRYNELAGGSWKIHLTLEELETITSKLIGLLLMKKV